jgi:hypothetical protein
MTLTGFPTRLYFARTTNAPAPFDRKSVTTAALAFLHHVGRRLADAPLDSPLLQARPVPRTSARQATRTTMGPH